MTPHTAPDATRKRYLVEFRVMITQERCVEAADQDEAQSIAQKALEREFGRMNVDYVTVLGEDE